jgi:hypothetical protein
MVFVNTLKDNIREPGAMEKLISDCALCISAWYSKPYHENQSFAEALFLNLSSMCVYHSIILPVLLLDGRPLCKLSQPDISKFLRFSFYEPVYYHSYSDRYPSVSNGKQGWWVGVATHLGDELTYKILTQKQQLIYLSAIRSAMDPAKWNQRLSPLGGETNIQLPW